VNTEIASFRPLEIPPDAPEASTDHQLIDLWLHQRSPHTQRAYRADIEQFQSHTPKAFRAVTLNDLQQFANSLTHGAPASSYRTLSAVKSILAFGHRLGYLPFDVGRALRLPSVRNRLNERILSEADLHRILTLETNPRNRTILTLLYASGIRVSELCTLAWRDLQPNAEGGQITVFGKGSKTRTIQLPASVWKLLGALHDSDATPDSAVFRSRKAKNEGFLQPLAVLRIVRTAAKASRHRTARLSSLVPPCACLSCARSRRPYPPCSGYPRPRQHHHHRTLPPRPPQ
jgi:site-specific recombinase XerC